MKFTCNRDYLAKLLGNIKGFDAPSRVRGTSGVVIDVQETGVSFLLGTAVPSTLKLDVTGSDQGGPAIVHEPGRVLVPLAKFHEVIGAITGDQVTLGADENARTLKIETGRQIAKLFCLADSNAMALQERNMGEPESWWGMETDTLAAGAGEVLFAVGTDYSTGSPVFTGVLVKAFKEASVMEFAATNGYIMAHRKVGALSAGEEDFTVICFPGFLAWAVKFAKSFTAENLKLAFVKDTIHASIQVDGLSCMVASGAIGGTYPDLSKYMNEHNETVAEIDLDELKSALRATRAFVKADEQGLLKVHFNGGIDLIVDDKQGTGASVHLDGVITGAEQTLFLNAAMLEKAVQAIGPGRARLSVKDQTMPLVLKPVGRDLLFVQMPIFVDSGQN